MFQILIIFIDFIQSTIIFGTSYNRIRLYITKVAAILHQFLCPIRKISNEMKPISRKLIINNNSLKMSSNEMVLRIDIIEVIIT